jgi:DNA repair protein RadC
MPMKDLPADQRPREKLLAHGAPALADAELLALLLRTGNKGQGVLQLAQAVLQRCDGFAGLLGGAADQLTGIKGLGPAKRAEILAVMEMARRALAQQMQAVPIFHHPTLVKDFVAMQLSGRSQEVFVVLFLDAAHRLLKMEEMFIGTVDQTSVYPREVLKRALSLNAAAVVFAHNHPSGMPEPSQADLNLTQRLKTALQLVDVKVLDHIVVGQGSVVSMAERNQL